eukprot:3894099-Amphidinium_carterae.2
MSKLKMSGQQLCGTNQHWRCNGQLRYPYHYYDRAFAFQKSHSAMLPWDSMCSKSHRPKASLVHNHVIETVFRGSIRQDINLH